MKNRKRFVTFLLNSGADPNIQNRITGMPLLHATARSGKFEVMQILLKKGVDISLQDSEERAILHWLAGVSVRKPSDKDKIEYCLKLLLS
jgi:ankyrin repeat protein